MVWQGHHRDEAANLAGIKPKSLYNAFGKHRRVEAMSESDQNETPNGKEGPE
jgi:hypothetical protein